MSKADESKYVVCHTNGNVLASFTSLEDARANAAERNARAQALGLSCKYKAKPK